LYELRRWEMRGGVPTAWNNDKPSFLCLSSSKGRLHCYIQERFIDACIHAK
jgi:hypothetical protein